MENIARLMLIHVNKIKAFVTGFLFDSFIMNLKQSKKIPRKRFLKAR
jgi:hypothetical protein